MDREETFGLSILMWKTTMMVKIVEPWKLIFPTVIKRQFFFLIFIVVHFAKKVLILFLLELARPRSLPLRWLVRKHQTQYDTKPSTG